MPWSCERLISMLLHRHGENRCSANNISPLQRWMAEPYRFQATTHQKSLRTTDVDIHFLLYTPPRLCISSFFTTSFFTTSFFIQHDDESYFTRTHSTPSVRILPAIILMTMQTLLTSYVFSSINFYININNVKIKQLSSDIEKRFTVVEKQVGAVDKNFGTVEKNFAAMEKNLSEVQKSFDLVRNDFRDHVDLLDDKM
ncbi:hypothetical protein V8E54_012670 [Elaphomyces granulatus]